VPVDKDKPEKRAKKKSSTNYEDATINIHSSFFLKGKVGSLQVICIN
jgi:hypothetical protein